jgi:putative ABC transport system permease protein
MLRHFFIAAVRNLAANRLLSAIAIFGLAIGIAAAILTGQVVRNQLSYDHFIPGYERTYVGVAILTVPGSAPNPPDLQTLWPFAPLIKSNIPEVEDATRLIPHTSPLRRGAVTVRDTINFADPNVFDVLPLPVLRGDLHTALRRPDTVVMTQSAARKYFGRDDALGQTVTIEGRPMVLTAVIADLPANQTELESGIFASAMTPLLSEMNRKPGAFKSMDELNDALPVHTYIRFKPGADEATTRGRIAALVKGVWPKIDIPYNYEMPLVRLDRLQLYEPLHPGARARLWMVAAIGLLVLFIATANFINLTVAASARREKEVGVRKVSGAARRHLVVQFLGEALVAVTLAACLALALSEWLMPVVNAFLQSGAALIWWNDPAFLLVLLMGTAVLAVAAGSYPAFLLASFRPASSLKGWTRQTNAAGNIRSALVILQFAILICLVIAAGVVWQQRSFATADLLRVDGDQILLVGMPAPNVSPVENMLSGGCNRQSFRDEVRKLPGVLDAVCSHAVFFNGEADVYVRLHGRQTAQPLIATQFAAFAFYGFKPVAGTIPPDRVWTSFPAGPVVINEAAVKRFGFASPAAAIGQFLPMLADLDKPQVTVRIAAVVPDFSLHSVETAVPPTIYSQGTDPSGLLSLKLSNKQDLRAAIDQLFTATSLLHLKLDGWRIPETLAAIDRLWTASGGQGQTPRIFLSQRMQALYLTMRRDAQLFAGFAGLALFLACMGLFGIAISTAERRTKEIGVRKAMGAGNRDIVRLLLWQFVKPVLWASLLAWPIAFWLMQGWLSKFAYHIALTPWFFLGASLLAVAIAVGTVLTHAILTARAVPAMALRYE